MGAGNREGVGKQRKTTNAGLKLDDPRCKFSSSTGEVLDFLQEMMKDDAVERQSNTGTAHKQEKAEAAKLHAQAAEKQAVAADKVATAALIKSKAELLD